MVEIETHEWRPFREVAWLIENASQDGTVIGLYLSVERDGGGKIRDTRDASFKFTGVPDMAIRFARKEDADGVIAVLKARYGFSANLVATEHSWEITYKP